MHYSEEVALNTSLARLVLLYREHIDQNTPSDKRQIVDLWTEETIDKIVKYMKVPKPMKYVAYDDYRPVLK